MIDRFYTGVCVILLSVLTSIFVTFQCTRKQNQKRPANIASNIESMQRNKSMSEAQKSSTSISDNKQKKMTKNRVGDDIASSPTRCRPTCAAARRHHNQPATAAEDQPYDDRTQDEIYRKFSYDSDNETNLTTPSFLHDDYLLENIRRRRHKPPLLMPTSNYHSSEDAVEKNADGMVVTAAPGQLPVTRGDALGGRKTTSGEAVTQQYWRPGEMQCIVSKSEMVAADVPGPLGRRAPPG